ncbi:MAG: maleylpyruvate isomerase N-terminal domain-containing protein [Microthrixaceae bacterium]|nr:maleylpyruvate isomerase N-terminal domain-containing protein [Acidimicrobiales bacterium]MCB9403701.1 maleylpyruvate isomerase N-terminal domain-containing protein [Microthrixaceae bacterium]
MPDTVFRIEETGDAFRFASHWWRSMVGAVDDDAWERPGLGEWTVRELVAHTDRAYRTVIDYLTGETVDPTPIATAAQYFRVVLAEETPHVHIAARAKREAAERDDWVVATDELALQCEKLIGDSPPDATCHLMVGEMPLDQYLATRVVELVVHGMDLADAIGLEVNPPPVSADVAARVLTDLAGEDGPATVVRALAGRSSARSVHVLQ